MVQSGHFEEAAGCGSLMHGNPWSQHEGKTRGALIFGRQRRTSNDFQNPGNKRTSFPAAIYNNYITYLSRCSQQGFVEFVMSLDCRQCREAIQSSTLHAGSQDLTMERIVFG